MRSQYWREKYSEYRQKNDQFITRDREVPEWFMNELHSFDPCLRVEWWNRSPGGGTPPSFRLVRVVDDGRWAHVTWFQLPDYSLINYLRASDTHRANKLPRDIFNEEMRKAREEHLAVLRGRDEYRERKVDDCMIAIDRMKERSYSYER